jgi:hypothetical protein
MPAGQPAEFTALARRVLGPDKLLVIFMPVSIEQDDASAITTRVREHVAAGADHVIAGQPIGTGFIVGVDHLEGLAPALVERP